MAKLRYGGKADPYLEWGTLTGFRFFSGEDRRIGLLIQWKSPDDARSALAIAQAMKVDVPGIFRGAPDGSTHAVPIKTVWGLSGDFKELIGFLDRAIEHALRVELAAAVRPKPAGDERFDLGQAVGSVLVGVLDDGFAFANRRFMRASGTRCLWLWNQDPGASGAALDGASGPSVDTDFGYGGQWSTVALNDVLTKQGTPEAAYRELGIDTLRRAATHGTHVADVLAGEDPAALAARGDDWDIVFVQFPRSGIEDPSGKWLSLYALHGLLYVLEAAGKQTRTVAVNLSWGPQTGPHDGSSPLEVAFEAAVTEQRVLFDRRVIIAIPAGNSFNAQAHASFDCASGGTVEWMIPPDGETPSFVEVWWPPSIGLGEATLTITSPAGDVVVVAPPAFKKDFGRFVIVKEQLGNSGVVVQLTVNPTESTDEATRGLHGRWLLHVHATTTKASGPIHLYVARADHNLGAKRFATRSYLTDRPYEASRFVAPSKRFDDVPASAVRREGTLNGIGTGLAPWIAGGFSLADLRTAPYASSGPSRGSRTQPDFSCVTDRSLERPGIRASAVRSGSKFVLVGTSTAAPQLARNVIVDRWKFYADPPTYQPRRDGTALMEADLTRIDVR